MRIDSSSQVVTSHLQGVDRAATHRNLSEEVSDNCCTTAVFEHCTNLYSDCRLFRLAAFVF